MPKDHKSGLLISFDGLDSTGKETQTGLLVERLRYAGKKATQLRSPDYTTPSGQELKLRLQNKIGKWEETSWQEKMKYFAANRAEHKAQVEAVLNAGAIVVYDRYVQSSVAFMVVEGSHPQNADLLRAEITKAVEEEEYGNRAMPKESVSIFLDVPPVHSARLLEKRKGKNNNHDEYTDSFQLQERLYNEYDILCRQHPTNFLRIRCIEGGEFLAINDIQELVWVALLEKFPSLKTDTLQV